jgi:hypothetical protein
LVDVAKKAGVEPGVLLGAGIVVGSLIVLVCLGGVILSVMVSVVYPAIKSI